MPGYRAGAGNIPDEPRVTCTRKSGSLSSPLLDGYKTKLFVYEN